MSRGQRRLAEYAVEITQGGDKAAIYFAGHRYVATAAAIMSEWEVLSCENEDGGSMLIDLISLAAVQPADPTEQKFGAPVYVTDA